MLNLFAGYDARELVGCHTFVASVMARASCPVSTTLLDSKGLPHGSNSFTFSRFLIPYLSDYRGHAIFADACDMLCLADIAELDALYDPRYAVQVVKRPDYISAHERKYIDTPMECEQSNYARKNWASLMIINCEHPAWAAVNPSSIAASKPLDLLQLGFCGDDIGELPPEWNAIVDEGDSGAEAKILHWSSGVPGFSHYRNAPYSHLWFNEYRSIGELA